MSEFKDFRLHVWGPYACFTRPEMKVERVSYDVMTPSSARGILEAILWKPAIRWVVTKIDVLNPIRWTSIRRNEVGAVISVNNLTSAMGKGRGDLGLYIEEERQQRAGLILRDVAYVIHAHFVMTDKAGHGDNSGKFLEMFRRRAETGQCFHQPYFGCREFAVSWKLLQDDENLKPIVESSKDLGWMLYDMLHSKTEINPVFFRAQLVNGSVVVPDINSSEVRV